ncbi:MAG TPA: hypothetical protein VFZ35_05840 [Sphingomicrobium sp.]
MPAYRLYHLDGTGRVDSADWLEATDDASAAAALSRLSMKAVSAELWLGKRRVARLDHEGVILDGGA